MIKHWTDKGIAEQLQKLEIISDTREQKNEHILDYLDSMNISHVTRKLDVGDYSAQIGDYSLEKDVVVERKHTLDEICTNLTSDRDRFEREFIRCRAFGIKVFLLIEDSSWNDIFLQNYRSKLSARSLLASLLAWQVRYNVTIIFCSSANTPKLIFQILYYAAREHLIYGKSN